MKPKEAFVKIGALISFLGLIGGGGVLAVSGIQTDNYGRFGFGVALAVIGIFVTAIFVTYIAHADGDHDFSEWTFSFALKSAGTFTFFAAILLFVGISVFFWISDGFWQLGVAGIVAFVLMIVIAVEWSIRWQTSSVKKVLADPDAVEFTGRVRKAEGHFNIRIFGYTKVFFYKYFIEVSDTLSITFLRGRDPLSKKLKAGDTVKIKMNPEKMKYCAIIEKTDE